MKYNYCYNCGEKTEQHKIEGKLRAFCKNCNFVLYKNPIPSVAIVAFNHKNELLLTKRAIEPGKGEWCLPGGFIEMGETIHQAVARELKEETNLECTNIQIIDADSVINGYWGDILILGYSVDLMEGKLMAGDDAAEVAFFPLQEKPPIIFPIHETFLNKRLKTKGINYE